MAKSVRRIRYKGVVWNQSKYDARVRHRGRDVYAGRWPTQKQAAIARDRLVLHLGLATEINFPRLGRKLGAASASELQRAARQLTKKARGASTKYFGVSWSVKFERWVAAVTVDKQDFYCGQFEDPKRAARVRDGVVLYFYRRKMFKRVPPLNFPGDATTTELSPEKAQALAADLRGSKTSRYRGVSFDSRRPAQPWVAIYQRTHIARYRTERAAAIAHDRAAAYYGGADAKRNFRAQKPASIEVLRAEALNMASGKDVRPPRKR